MTNIDKVKNKLKKLLALATSPNKHEAEAAMQKAEQLMQYHGIETIDITPDKKSANVALDTIEFSRKWEITIAAIIADFFDSRVIVSENKILIIGGITDAELTSDMFKRIRRVVGVMANSFQKANKHLVGTKKSITDSYITGISDTLQYRLHVVKTARTPPPTTRDLVLVEKDAVDDYCQELFGDTIKKKIVKQKSSMHYNAYTKGVIDGKTLELHKSVQA